MNIVASILQALLGLVFLASGGSKLAGVKQMVENFNIWRFPRWFLSVTGAVEVLGALGLFLGFWKPIIAVLAGAWLACTMIGAVLTHFTRDPKGPKAGIPAGILLILTLVVTSLRLTNHA